MRQQDKIQHRSMRGTIVDMDALRLKHATDPAIGNANMNANGDILGKGGRITIRREQITQAYYQNNPQGVKNASLKQPSPETFETPQQAVERLTKKINKPVQADPQPTDTSESNHKIRNMLDKS
jgi:hypothetical protein